MKKSLILALCSFSLVSTAFAGTSSLRMGLKNNPEVKVIQQKLMDLGLYSGKIDGSFGPRTFTAVKTFQTQNGLKVDGIVGNQVRSNLFKNSQGYDCNNMTISPKVTMVEPQEYRNASFRAGEVVTMKWSTQDIPSDDTIELTLLQTTGDSPDTSFNLGSSVNDGTETVTIPSKNTWSDMKYGKHFDIIGHGTLRCNNRTVVPVRPFQDITITE